MNTSRQCIEDVGKLKMYSPLFIGSCKTASFESGGGAEVGGGGGHQPPQNFGEQQMSVAGGKCNCLPSTTI